MTIVDLDAAGWWLDEYDRDRFWGRVNFNGGTAHKSDALATAEGECWNWTGALTEAGYGRFRVFGSWMIAHAAAFRDFGNDIGPGLEIDHLCRNRACVRPVHLEAVTHAVNVARGLVGNKA